jgi:hypothetical protein
LEIMMRNVSNPKYILASFAVMGAVVVLLAFLGRDQGKGLDAGLASIGLAGEQEPKLLASAGNDEARPDCGSLAFSPFGDGTGCTEGQSEAADTVATDTGMDDFNELAASAEELAARLKLMTNKALAGDTGAFAWYISMYTNRCYQLEPEQFAAITECDPALRSRVDAQFVQVASKLAAANNTEAQLALGRWYLAQGARKYAAANNREANADIASAQADSVKQTAATDGAGLPVVQSSNERNYQLSAELRAEYQTAAQWFARAAAHSPAAADFLAFTNDLLAQ